MKSRKQNVVVLLQKEIQQLENEEAELKRKLQNTQNVIKDIRQAIITLQGSQVHVPLSAKVIDAVQQLQRFVPASEIADHLLQKEPYLDLRALKRDINSVLNRMRKRGMVVVQDISNMQYYGLQDWVNDKGEPQASYAAKR